MNLLRLTVLSGLVAAALGARAQEREHNVWPFVVVQRDPAAATATRSGLGPFAFSQPAPDGGTVRGFRPLWVETRDAAGDFRAATFLYPLFSYSADAEIYSWSVFQLINRTARRDGAPAAQSLLGTPATFDVWPFWFSRTTGDPEMQYRALFPIAGTVRGKLSYERLSWIAFPLYVETEKHGAVTTSAPWPFVRVTRGAAHGFALWPLFGWQERPGVSRDEFYLWPLGYNNTRRPTPDDPPGTTVTRQIGALPFYARAEGPGYFGEDFVWPFFGHTERTAPKVYRETRWFWPLLVQGRGENHYVNRWAPLYTHSVVNGYDKTWFAWPLWREAKWTADGVAQTKSQLLWFLYWSQRQQRVANPHSAPASLTHVWPLFSTWDNGAGRKQFQLFSPLPVFFPQVEKVHQAWSPLFAIFRYDQRAAGDERWSLLWNGVTWQRQEATAHEEFHLGPLFSTTTHGSEKRVAFLSGLFGLKREAGATAWRWFWLDFPAKPATDLAAHR